MEPKMKLGIALAVAVVALSTAGYLGYSALGGGRTVRSASEASAENRIPVDPGASRAGEDAPGEGRRMEFEGEAPPWMQENIERSKAYADPFEFPDADDAAMRFEDGASDLALRAETDDALSTLGIATRRSLIETWAAFMKPLLSGDAPAFERTLADLGSPNAEAGAALHERLSAYLGGARVAMGAARIRAADPTQRGSVPMGMPNVPGMPEGATAIPMMIGVMESADDATGETTTIREMNIPLAAVFPEAAEAAKAGARTVEVWAPAKMKSTKGDKADFGPSVFFTFDEQSRAWQPVAMRVALASEAATSSLESMMRTRRRAIEQD